VLAEPGVQAARAIVRERDGAGATHQLLRWIESLNRPARGNDPDTRVEHSAGSPADAHTGQAIRVKPLRDITPKPPKGAEQLELDLRTTAAGWRYEASATNHNIPPTPKETPQQITT
jgi:hypothetical protein